VLEQHEQLWNVALQSYQDEMTRNPELADPGDTFNNWVWSTKVGGYIAEADNSALGSYARSFDQLRGRRRRNGVEYTSAWGEETEGKAVLAYNRTFDRAINAHPFTGNEVAAYFQDLGEAIDRVRHLGFDFFDDAESLDDFAAIEQQMLAAAN
jgi:hypothetical protein